MIQTKKRLIVDMSATLIHQGHIRLLQRARKAADERDAIVVVALTSDAELLKVKGYLPELNFAERKEILLSCRYVDEVAPTPWLLDEEVFRAMRGDYLFHGADNNNPIPAEKLIIVPRTPGVSSSELRLRSAQIIQSQINEHKIMLTPGPGSIPLENAFAVQPLFGRGDDDFTELEERVF
ncbi:MAG: adenylyltransferase/cytidyltransferase family protein, partial [Spirochaetota bacterium]